VTYRTGNDPLYDLAFSVACWMSVQKVGKSRDEINAAIAETLVHLAPDERDDIVHRAIQMVRKQFAERRKS
jgi:hypothetical protein